MLLSFNKFKKRKGVREHWQKVFNFFNSIWSLRGRTERRLRTRPIKLETFGTHIKKHLLTAYVKGSCFRNEESSKLLQVQFAGFSVILKNRYKKLDACKYLSWEIDLRGTLTVQVLITSIANINTENLCSFSEYMWTQRKWIISAYLKF